MAIHWEMDAYGEDTSYAYLNGIEAEVVPLAAEFRTPKPGPQLLYAWSVKPTGTRCEWPELYAYGEAATRGSAMKKAEAKMRKADKAYPTMGEDGW